MRKSQMNRYQAPSHSAQKGIVLLESLIAVLIFSMGILAIAGLQAAMVKNTSDAKYRSDAAFIAQQRLGVMWADPDNLANYVEADTDISTLLPDGKRTVTLPAVGGEVSVVVTWQVPGQALHNFSTNARITGG
jgi:type IV pilus assembly protein PilV